VCSYKGGERGDWTEKGAGLYSVRIRMGKQLSILGRRLFIVMAAIMPFGMWWWIACVDHGWAINRIRPTSPLSSIPVSPTDDGQKEMREAVRKEIQKGTSIDDVRRYIEHHFVDDGHLLFEETVVNKNGPRPWPPRIRITIREGGHTFAGSHHTRLAFFFDDDGRLDAVNVESDSNYL
jgi:hypothetical protein